MKKFLGLLCSATLLISQWSFNPVESQADTLSVYQKADVLNQVYVLTGDGTSYNLEGQLKRSEASAFIVKVLGVQNTVLQQKELYSQTNFKDVPKSEWYAPYVGYMTKYGIITGYPDGTFKPNEYISEKAFYSLVLKAMGYTSNDFDWNNIYKAAYEAGLVDDINFVFRDGDNTNFRRSDVVNTLYNALGKPMKGKDKKFIQLLIDSKMISPDKADLFGFAQIDKLPTAVQSVSVPNANQIVLSLNEAITKPDVSQVSVYVKENSSVKLNVKNIDLTDSTLTIYTDTQAEKSNYVVELNGVTDTLGNKVAQVKSECTGYVLPLVDSPFFKVAKVEPVSEKAVNVYFTQPVGSGAELELLYDFYKGDTKFVEGSYKTLAIKRYDSKTNMITITLKDPTFDIGTDYTLKIKSDLKSNYGVNLNSGSGESVGFKAAKLTTGTNLISNIYSQQSVYVYVEFSQAVDPDSALIKENYAIRELDTGRTVYAVQVYPLKAGDKKNKAFVIRTTGTFNTKIYELAVNNVYDTYKANKLSEMKKQFYGSATTDDYTTLVGVTAVNNGMIVATFDRELKDISANAQVTVEGGPAVMYKEVDSDDPRNLKIYINRNTPLIGDRMYLLRVGNGIMDLMDRTLQIAAIQTFKGSSIQMPPLGFDSATFIDESTILVKYNQPVNKALAGTADRYELTYSSDGKTDKLLIITSVEMVSDRTVVIKIPYAKAQGTYKLKVKNVTDVTGQASATDVTTTIK